MIFFLHADIASNKRPYLHIETMKLMNTHKSKELDDLPEDILLCILCLLPLKDAVRTSALSRGWKHLWTCTPTFNFTSPILTNMGITAVDQNAQLVHLIYSALTFRDSSSLNAFRLHFSLEQAKEILILSSWIMDASFKYNVQSLYLSFSFRCKMLKPYSHYLLPSYIS